MKKMTSFVLALWLCANAHGEYAFGKKHPIENDLFKLDAVELLIDGKFVGFVAVGTQPLVFSRNYYAYATCGLDNKTHKPNDYCINWHIYDLSRKMSRPLALPGLTFSSKPSFSWPFVAYLQVPDKITKVNFESGVVDVSCVVVEWPNKKVVARSAAKVSVGYFETDVPESFNEPSVKQSGDSKEFTCSDYEGKAIAKVHVPVNKKQ